MDAQLQKSMLKRIDKLTTRIGKDLKELEKLREEVATGILHVPESALNSSKKTDIPSDYYDEDGDPTIHVEGKPDINLYTGEEVRIGRRGK